MYGNYGFVRLAFVSNMKVSPAANQIFTVHKSPLTKTNATVENESSVTSRHFLLI